MADALYAGKKASLRPLHDQLMAMVHAMGPDVSLAPKKGYVSLRRPRKQFAMIQPSGAGRIDLGLILPGVPQAAAGAFRQFQRLVHPPGPGDVAGDLTTRSPGGSPPPTPPRAEAAGRRQARLGGDGYWSGNSTPRSPAGRGPKIRRWDSEIARSLMLASRRRIRPCSSNSHSSLP